MRIRGFIRSTETRELTGTGDDTAAARAVISSEIPDGFELIQLENTMQAGTVTATGTIQSTATGEIEAAGADYTSALATLRAQLPNGYRLAHIVTIE